MRKLILKWLGIEICTPYEQKNLIRYEIDKAVEKIVKNQIRDLGIAQDDLYIKLVERYKHRQDMEEVRVKSQVDIYLPSLVADEVAKITNQGDFLEGVVRDIKGIQL
jgi:hypothetical protein